MQITRNEFEHVRKDISHLKQELLQLRKLLKEQPNDFRLIKSREVRRMLEISASTLQTMRKKGTIPYRHLDGLLRYEYNEIINLLLKGKPVKQ